MILYGIENNKADLNAKCDIILHDAVPIVLDDAYFSSTSLKPLDQTQHGDTTTVVISTDSTMTNNSTGNTFYSQLFLL